MADFNKDTFKAAADKAKRTAARLIWEVRAMPDATFEFSNNDIQDNKLLSMLAYVPVAVLLPFFWHKISGKVSHYMQFHAKQGMVLFIIELLAALVLGTFARIPVIGFIFSLAKALVYIACAALAAKNIWDVLNGKAKRMPYVNKFIK